MKCPWPWVPTPVATLTLPVASTVIRAPSYGPTPRAFREAGDADAHVLAFGAQLRLFFLEEFVVADHLAWLCPASRDNCRCRARSSTKSCPMIPVL